jgi:hypothetical protein
LYGARSRVAPWRDVDIRGGAVISNVPDATAQLILEEAALHVAA